MIEHQPTLVREERYRTCPYLGTLPGTFGERRRSHHMAVFAPEFHVRAEANVDVAKRSMSAIAGTAQERIFAIELLRQQHTVAVERQESILALEELLEIESIADADGGAVVAVTPRNPVAVLNPCHARIVFIFGLYHVRIPGLELDWLMLYFPVDAVLAETGKDIHLHRPVVTTEHTGITILKRNHRTVENAVRRRNMVAVYYGILRITPHYILTACRPFFPRHCDFVAHNCSILLIGYCCFFSSAYVNGMKYVMRNAGMVANSVKVKNASYPNQSLTKPLIVPGNITPRFMMPEAKA